MNAAIHWRLFVPRILAEKTSFHHAKIDDDQRHVCKFRQNLRNKLNGLNRLLEWDLL